MSDKQETQDDQEISGEPVSVFVPSTRQKKSYRCFAAVLIDLVVLGLFAKYWIHLELEIFTNLLLAAILLQASMQAIFKIEHYCASFFIGKSGLTAKFLRPFVTWLIVFGSKFVMLVTRFLWIGSMVLMMPSKLIPCHR